MQRSVQETNSWELFIPRFLKVSTARPQVDWAELSSAKDMEWAKLGCTFLIGTVPATRFVGSNLGAWGLWACGCGSLATGATGATGPCPRRRGKPVALLPWLPCTTASCTRTRDQGPSRRFTDVHM